MIVCRVVEEEKFNIILNFATSTGTSKISVRVPSVLSQFWNYHQILIEILYQVVCTAFRIAECCLSGGDLKNYIFLSISVWSSDVLRVHLQDENRGQLYVLWLLQPTAENLLQAPQSIMSWAYQGTQGEITYYWKQFKPLLLQWEDEGKWAAHLRWKDWKHNLLATKWIHVSYPPGESQGVDTILWSWESQGSQSNADRAIYGIVF